MQVIIISSNNKTHKHWHLTKAKLLVLMTLVVALISISSYSFANWANKPVNLSPTSAIPHVISEQSSSESTEISASQQDAIDNFYAKQLGGLQAETIRLRMLSQRLAEIAGFDTTEFTLDEHPAQGGLDDEGMFLSSCLLYTSDAADE